VINDPTLLLNVITSDECIVYAYDPETKLQSSQWKSPGSPRPKKACIQKSKLKTILICFFDQEGIVQREFVPPGMTVNADFYCAVLRRLRENVRRKRPQKWQNQNLINHHDNGYLTQFQKEISSDASKHDRNAGTAVFVQNGSTLKVMEEFDIQVKQTSFYKYCPGAFGYVLVGKTFENDIKELDPKKAYEY